MASGPSSPVSRTSATSIRASIRVPPPVSPNGRASESVWTSTRSLPKYPPMDTTGPPRPTNDRRARRAIVLTSHPANANGGAPKIHWGAADPDARGPIVGTLTNAEARNAIGTHAGAYSLYRALAVAAGQLDAGHRPDLTDTAPAEPIGPFPQWSDPERIVSLDPWGHLVGQVFAPLLREGWDIRPTIAVTKAR